MSHLSFYEAGVCSQSALALSDLISLVLTLKRYSMVPALKLLSLAMKRLDYSPPGPALLELNRPLYKTPYLNLGKALKHPFWG